MPREILEQHGGRLIFNKIWDLGSLLKLVMWMVIFDCYIKCWERSKLPHLFVEMVLLKSPTIREKSHKYEVSI